MRDEDEGDSNVSFGSSDSCVRLVFGSVECEREGGLELGRCGFCVWDSMSEGL